MLYKVIYTLFEQGKCKSKRIENVKSLESINGYANAWQSNAVLTKNGFAYPLSKK